MRHNNKDVIKENEKEDEEEFNGENSEDFSSKLEDERDVIREANGDKNDEFDLDKICNSIERENEGKVNSKENEDMSNDGKSSEGGYKAVKTEGNSKRNTRPKTARKKKKLKKVKNENLGNNTNRIRKSVALKDEQAFSA